MRRLIGVAALVFVGVLVWQIGSRLSTDAIGMGVGMIFGVLAGMPAALLVLAADGRRQHDENDTDDGVRSSSAYRLGFVDGQSQAQRILQSQATQAQLHTYIVDGRYSTARPFAIQQQLSEFDIDDDPPDWWHPGILAAQNGRQFRITGEVER